MALFAVLSVVLAFALDYVTGATVRAQVRLCTALPCYACALWHLGGAPGQRVLCVDNSLCWVTQVADPKEMEAAKSEAANIRHNMAKLKGATPVPGSSLRAGSAATRGASASASATAPPALDGGNTVHAVIQLVPPSVEQRGPGAGSADSALSRPGTTIADVSSSLPFEPITLAFKGIR